MALLSFIVAPSLPLSKRVADKKKPLTLLCNHFVQTRKLKHLNCVLQSTSEQNLDKQEKTANKGSL